MRVRENLISILATNTFKGNSFFLVSNPKNFLIHQICFLIHFFTARLALTLSMIYASASPHKKTLHSIDFLKQDNEKKKIQGTQRLNTFLWIILFFAFKLQANRGSTLVVNGCCQRLKFVSIKCKKFYDNFFFLKYQKKVVWLETSFKIRYFVSSFLELLLQILTFKR